MKVHVASIVDAFGQGLVTKVFSTKEQAAEWQRKYVKENWSKHYEGKCPIDLDEAVHEYFFGGIVVDENFVNNEYEVDEVIYNHFDSAVDELKDPELKEKSRIPDKSCQVVEQSVEDWIKERILKNGQFDGELI